MNIDFTRSETIKRLAELPYAGWAAAIIHRVDPLWGQDSRVWKVSVVVANGCSKCDGQCCGNEDEIVHCQVDADSEREAETLAMRLHPGKFVFGAELVAAFPDPDVPEWALKLVAEAA